MGTTDKSSVDKDKFSSKKSAATDVGAEEFSEKIYDESAPISEEFDQPHDVSVTGADLHGGSEQQHK